MMHTTTRTAAVLAFGLMALAATAAQAASVPDELIRITWRDYDAIYMQDGWPVNDSPDFVRTAKGKKLDAIDKQCRAQVKAALVKEAPAQVGDEKTAADRKQRIARSYLTCMLVEKDAVPTLAQVFVVVAHRRTNVELQPFKPGDKTSLTD
jgi:hypothetical protein